MTASRPTSILRASTMPKDRRARGAASAILQALAILLLVLMFSVILHKGFADVAALAQKHSGVDFWRALLRYLLANLGA
jgi:hypothetical protein